MNIPESIQPKQSVGRYLNKIEPGESVKVLMLASPTGAFEYWEDTPEGRRPYREPMTVKKAMPEGTKSIWLVPVLDMDTGTKRLWSIAQKSIQQQITNLAKDEDYDLDHMPLKILREGSTLQDTRYTVNVLPPVKLTDEQLKEVEEVPCVPEEVFEGGDPFNPDDIPV